MISATFSFFGIRYSAKRKDMPWSVGAMRKTFGRLAAIDEPLAALVGDRERDVRVARDPPRGVDAGAFVDDRDRAVGDRACRTFATAVRADRPGVVALDPEAVLDPVRLDGRVRRGELGAVGDRLADVRRLRERRVDRDRQRLGPCRSRSVAAAAGEEHAHKRDEDQDESDHESFCRPRYAMRTASSAATSASVPDAIRVRLRARSPRSATRRTKRRLCSMTRSARPLSRSSSRSSARRSSSAADAPAAGSSRSRTRGCVCERGGEHQQALLVRASARRPADPGRGRPTSSSAPSAFVLGDAVLARAFGVRNTVRNGPSCCLRRPRRRGRSGAR